MNTAKPMRYLFSLLMLALPLLSLPLRAELPTGYFVWIKGEEGDRSSRKVYRMTLPEKNQVMALTGGEDVECQISPGGKWVAYAKAKLPDSDYHQFNRFKLFVVSIHGVGEGREELKIDDNGYWPSWSDDHTLHYSQVDDDNRQHTKVIRVTLDDYGNVENREVIFTSHDHFANIREVNEAFVAPDGSWFAARTRGSASVTGVGAFSVDPADFSLLARAGSVGCMPYVAPSGTWGFIAGRDQGIRWGDAPGVSNRRQDELLIAPRSSNDLCYHPGISTDENWVMAAHSSEDDHNAGPYNVYLYKLNSRTATDGQALASGGFNGWPHIWVGEPSDPPPPLPHVDAFYPESYTILAGDQVELFWLTSFADTVQIDGSAVDVDGSLVVTPNQTTTYTLLAQSTLVDETDSVSVEVTVNQSPQAVQIEELKAQPSTIVAGNTSVLTWSVKNATTLEVNGKSVPPSGSMDLNPMQDTVYVLTALGHQGPVSKKVKVTVDPLADLFEELPDRGGCFCPSAQLSVVNVSWPLLAGCALWWVRRRYRS